MLSHNVWRHNDIMIFDFRKRSITVLRVNFSTFSNAKKLLFFSIFHQGHSLLTKSILQNFIGNDQSSTLKISFCKLAVPLVKFAIKDLKTTENIKARLLYQYLAPYYTRGEGQHRRISADSKNRNVQHKKKKKLWHFYSLIDFFPIYKADSGGSWTVSFINKINKI